jgi:hypothetical protein
MKLERELQILDLKFVISAKPVTSFNVYKNINKIGKNEKIISIN